MLATLYFLFAIIVMVMLSKVFDKIQFLHNRFDSIDNELNRFRAELLADRKSREKPVSPPVTAKPATQAAPIVPKPDVVQAPPLIITNPERTATPAETPVIPTPAPPVPAPEAELKPAYTPPVTPPEIIYEKPKAVAYEQAAAPIIASAAPYPPETTTNMSDIPEEPEPSFLEKFRANNPDIEKFIGENLINKIGIAILVLGIGYFVKFAIDKNWINEIGRVFIGILAGGTLIGLAHWLRKKLPAFSSVLVGGGLAVLYFTIAIAFHEYQIFSQTAAFLIMVVITGFSIVLSVSYNRVELAVLALVGGFTTPFMVSTGEGNYQVLFTYVLILNVGMLVLAYLKGWKIINWIAYGFTLILYGGWLSTRVLTEPNGPYLGAFIFGSAYFVVFFLMNIIYNLKERAKFGAIEMSILLSNTFLYYSSGMMLLKLIQGGLYQGLFTVALAVFNFAFAYYFYRRQAADKNLVSLLMGLVITFVSLAIPVQLEGNYITMFWALEAVLILWLSQKMGIRLMALSSVVVTALMLISLIMDWLQIYGGNQAGPAMRIILNKGFVTSFMALAGLGATVKLLKPEPEIWPFRYLDFNVKYYRRIIGVTLTALLYFTLLLELHYHLANYVPSVLTQTLISGTYHLLFMVGIALWVLWRKRLALVSLTTSLGLFGILGYTTLLTSTVFSLIKAHFLGEEAATTGFVFHYANLLLVGVLIYLCYQKLMQYTHEYPATPKLVSWTLSVVLVYIASSELLFHVLYFNVPATAVIKGLGQKPAAAAYEQFSYLIRQTNKVGFPILWGVFAFGLMFVGLQSKNKNLRIISLSLFTLTLAKLFLYDIRGISEGGKIAAFISLGVLLLVISFMYQNIKRMILTDERPVPAVSLPDEES